MSNNDTQELSESYDMIMLKIDDTKEKLNNIVNTFSEELKDCIFQFTNNINKKFIMQSEELEKLKTELKAKKFEDHNYNNVSVIKNQDKQIREHQNTIKALEGRLKFAESKNDDIKKEAANKKEAEVVVVEAVIEPVSEPVIEPIAEPVIETKKTIKKSIAISKGKTTKPVQECKDSTESTESEVVVEAIVEKPKKKIAVKKTKAEPKVDIKPVEDSIIDEDVIEIKVEPSIIESIIEDEVIPVIIPVSDPIIEIKKEVEEIEEIEDKVDEEVKEVIPIKKEPIKKEQPIKKDPIKKEQPIKKETIKKEISKKESSKKEVLKKEAEVIVEAVNIVVKYPDIIPDINDVEVLEFNNNDYYMDKLNNVYQMTEEDQDIGIFIGVYHKSSNKILPITL
uniref:Uncharacterized protein n=1 Tax=viral metagenome TaxID=1070528 RepID=A0A6C0F015_9ZZZZ